MLSIKFVFRNFLYLAVFCAGPSLLLAYYYRDSSILTFFKNLFTGAPKNSYFYFSFISGEAWYLAIITLLLIGVTFSLVFAYINRVLKIGSRSLFKSIKKTSETIVPVFLTLLIIIIIVQIFALFAFGLAELLLMTDNATVYRILIPLILAILYAAMLFMILHLFMAIPTMLTLGYRFRESIGYSIKLSKGKIFKFVLACLVVCLFILGLSALSNILLNDILWGKLIFSTISYMLFFMYFPALMMIAFYDINGMNRLDIKRKFIYS